MIVALVISLGFLISSSPGLVSPASSLDFGPPVLLAERIVVAGMDSKTDHGLPGTPSRDGLTEADAEEEDDEMVALRRVPTSSVPDPAVEVQGQDHPTAARNSGDGLLHELHHSWQLLC